MRMPTIARPAQRGRRQHPLRVRGADNSGLRPQQMDTDMDDVADDYDGDDSSADDEG